MLQLDILRNSNHDEKDYYDYRKAMHDIYDKDVWYGDLVGDILAYREKDKHVESINIDISSYKIYTELDEKSTENDIENAVSNIEVILANFMNTISPNTDDKVQALIDRFSHSNWPICDFYVNGTSIEFNL